MVSLKCLTKDFIIFSQAEKYGYFRLFVAILGQKKSRNNLNSAVSALTGRGIRTCTLCRTLAFGRKTPSAKGFFESLLLRRRRKQAPDGTCFPLGRGIRIRTLNDGVRVRSVTVTLYLYIIQSKSHKWQSLIAE